MRVLLRRALTAVKRFPVVTPVAHHGLPAPLIITLTSYPPRFPDLVKTLRSLLDQAVPADTVQLWIAHDDIEALPDDVRTLEEYGLEIHACEDTRSYKKLIPALTQRPDCFYVTADDDVYYPPDWLASLVAEQKTHPGAVIATRSHMAHFDEDEMLAPYASWELAASQTSNRDDGRVLFPTGVGGVLYPPGCFADQVLDKEIFLELCPRGDDIWFFWMARMAGTKHRRVSGAFDIIDWPNSQEVALASQNLFADGNDGQIRAMEKHFGPVPDVMSAKP
ncbi:MAG: glycosyltransferase family 2 protein [Pseudomonadota bacterium]